MTLGFSQISYGSLTNCFMKVATHFDRISTNLKIEKQGLLDILAEAQAEALDALHYLAGKFSLTLDFQKGDVQYVNNLSIFHARDGFTDELGKE